MLDAPDRALWLTARRRLFRPVDATFAALAVACAAGVRVPEVLQPELLQYVPFAVSLVLLGLPHGALDHLVPSRLARRSPDLRAIAAVVGLYLLVGAAILVLWFASPALAFVAFVVTTWFHWGQGDLFVETTRDGTGNPSRATRAGILLIRGALPMVVPLIAAPQVYLAVFRDATGVVSAPPGDAAEVVVSPAVRIALALTLGLLALVTFVGTARARWGTPAGRRAWWGDLGEVVLLTVFFVAVPPILAIGLYFCLWHSLRHIVRLSMLDPGSRAPLQLGRPVVALQRFALQSAPVTLVALILLVALFLALPRADISADALLGVYLVLISALTAPHVVIVSMMDRTQGVWSETLGRTRTEPSTVRR